MNRKKEIVTEQFFFGNTLLRVGKNTLICHRNIVERMDQSTQKPTYYVVYVVVVVASSTCCL